MQTDLVKQGYGKLASEYVDYRVNLKTGKYIQQLLKYVPKRSTILDVGCGAGVPVDDVLLKAGHHVIGLDNSPEQIAQAQKHCPGGEYIVGDMQALTEDEYHVRAVISLYSLFHVPRTKHQALLNTFASYLPRGGMLLITMGDREFEGTHQLLGQSLWSSQYGTAKNRSLVERAGLRVILDEVSVSGGERHQVILAQKV